MIGASERRREEIETLRRKQKLKKLSCWFLTATPNATAMMRLAIPKRMLYVKKRGPSAILIPTEPHHSTFRIVLQGNPSQPVRSTLGRRQTVLGVTRQSRRLTSFPRERRREKKQDQRLQRRNYMIRRRLPQTSCEPSASIPTYRRSTRIWKDILQK